MSKILMQISQELDSYFWSNAIAKKGDTLYESHAVELGYSVPNFIQLCPLVSCVLRL